MKQDKKQAPKAHPNKNKQTKHPVTGKRGWPQKGE